MFLFYVIYSRVYKCTRGTISNKLPPAKVHPGQMLQIIVCIQVTSNTNSPIILHFNAYTYGDIFEQSIYCAITCNSPSL